jgi:hypothetical protein
MSESDPLDLNFPTFFRTYLEDFNTARIIDIDRASTALVWKCEVD